VSPAVPANSSLLRLSLMATHTFAQIEEAVEKMARAFRMLEIDAVRNDNRVKEKV
jgi:hypothetical protein